jgi:DNA-binding response OmpR family regulator
MASKILIVEDEPALQDTLEYNLTHQGYEVQVVGDGFKAIETARDFRPDLVLLDVMLPGMDGFEVCRILRQETNVPILMLTARDTEIDRVIGLEIGADDYITKPFSMRELQARLKALLRRVRFDQEDAVQAEEVNGSAGDTNRQIFGDLILDLSRHELSRDGRPLSLKPKEYDLFVYLARHKGKVLTRDLIMESVWGWDYTGGSRTLDVHVRWLREKIEPDPANPVRIVTVRGAGYRFEG